MRTFRKLRLGGASAALLTASLIVCLTANAMAEGVAFEIAAGDAATTLKQFAAQAHVQLLFDYKAVARLKTPALRGQYEPREALNVLLRGTGFSFRVVNDHTFAVMTPGSAATPSATSTSQSSPSSGADQKEGKNDSSGGFRLAQAAPGQTSGPGTLAQTEQTPGTLQEVVVTGRYEFLSADTSGTTNLPLPIELVPQSISLVSNDFITAADLKTLGQIAEYTPGAINVGTPENEGTAIELRGFTPGRSVDGINLLQSYGFFEPDYAIYDRLEVVKGPSSVVYGVSSPGGDINYVTKSATAQTPDYASLQTGSWRNFRFEGQIAGALDADGHVRAIGIAVQDQGDSFLNEIYHRKTSLYGGINMDFSDAISGYLHGGYERLERPTFDGIPTEPDGTAAPLPRSFCICAESIALTNSVYHLESALTWHTTNMLDLSVKGNYERDTQTGSEDYSYGLAQNGDINIAVSTFEPVRDNNYGLGVSAVYKLDDVGLKKSFLSLSGLYQSSQQGGSFPATYGTTSIFLGQAAVSQALISLLATPLAPYTQVTDALTRTVSAQAVVHIVDPLSVLVGASYSKPHETEMTNGVTQDFDITGQVSYRGGIEYEFGATGTNIYFSYSQSFNPQSFLAPSGAVLPPLTGDQYELGIKQRAADGRLLLTAAAYQITERNVAEFAEQIGPTEYFQSAGQVRHRGFELQALGRITSNWQVNAGYAYLDPKVTEDINPAVAGQTELFLPKQTFSLYTTYSFQLGRLRGLTVGGGARYVSNQRTSYESSVANAEAGLTPTRNLPGYGLVDATIGYAFGKWLLQLNGHNVFDRRYFLNNYQTLFYGNAPGDPANLAIMIRRSF